MFYYIDGILTYRDQNIAVLDCGGIGYKLSISLLTSDELTSKLQTRVKLFTYLKVSEDDMELFGFLTKDELDLFKLLMTVSGVGPKASISILSVLSPENLRLAICTENIKAISKAPNVGSKTAARIVMELKEKVAKEFGTLSVSSTTSSSTTGPKASGKLTDAIEALTALGYDRSTALSALNGLDVDKLSLNDLIQQALKKFL